MSPKLIIGFMGAHKGCAKILIKLNIESLLCCCFSFVVVWRLLLFVVCRGLLFVIVCCMLLFVCLFVCFTARQAKT